MEQEWDWVKRLSFRQACDLLSHVISRINAGAAEVQSDAAAIIEHRGWRFTAPFHCFYCGDPISARQFAFSRSCGGCDISNSSTQRLSVYEHRVFAGPHERVDEKDSADIDPEWLDPATREQYPRMRMRQMLQPKLPPRVGPPRLKRRPGIGSPRRGAGG